MDDFVRRARHDVFLGEHFHAVGNKLAEAGETDFGERNADAVGAVAVLDTADAFALENGGDGKHAGKHRQTNAMQINDEASGRKASGTKLTSQCRAVTKI